MCSRTVAVSAACRATCMGCAPAVWSPAPHNGQGTAAPPTPAAKSNVTFNDENMVNLLTQHEFRPPGEGEQRDRDDRRRPQRPFHPAAGNRRGTQGAKLARPLLLTPQLDEAEAERQHGTRDEIGPQRFERRGEPCSAEAEGDGDERSSAAQCRHYGRDNPASCSE